MNQDKRIHTDDVDDVIEIASEIARKQEDQVAVEDVVAIGEELDLDRGHVKQAIGELDERRRQEALAAAARRRKRKIALAVAGGVAALVVVLAIAGQRSLAGLAAEVEARRAQVRTVVERQAATQARVAGLTDERERDAELAGAQNRVSVERRRYDQAAAEYNRAAGSLPGSLWRAVFGMDARAPLSDEIAAW